MWLRDWGGERLRRRVAWTVCPKGTLAMRLRDEFAEVFSAEDIGRRCHVG